MERVEDWFLELHSLITPQNPQNKPIRLRDGQMLLLHPREDPWSIEACHGLGEL